MHPGNIRKWLTLVWGGVSLIVVAIPISLTAWWQLFFVFMFGGIVLIISGVVLRASGQAIKTPTTSVTKTADTKSALQSGLLITIIFSVLVFAGMALLLMFAFSR